MEKNLHGFTFARRLRARFVCCHGLPDVLADLIAEESVTKLVIAIGNALM